MLRITLKDRRRNNWIRRVTEIKDVGGAVAELMWVYAGNFTRYDEERLSNLLLIIFSETG